MEGRFQNVMKNAYLASQVLSDPPARKDRDKEPPGSFLPKLLKMEPRCKSETNEREGEDLHPGQESCQWQPYGGRKKNKQNPPPSSSLFSENILPNEGGECFRIHGSREFLW